MTSLSHHCKEIIKSKVRSGFCLELFPGQNTDSLEFLNLCTHKKVFALCDVPFKKSNNIELILKRVPPYPDIDIDFNIILVSEAEWLVAPEHGSLISFDKCPKNALSFISKHLAKKGYFVIANVDFEIAKIVSMWLGFFGKYDFEYSNDVAIYQKV
jgi:hypothetical protein